jgi:hypothetical protein
VSSAALNFAREEYSMKLERSHVLLLVAALTFAVWPVWAQTTTGIRGTITDPSGSVVPGAKVTITNIETQLTQSTRTSAEGIYAFTLLPIGNYKLHVAGSGFKTLERTGITLSINQVLGLNLALRWAL